MLLTYQEGSDGGAALPLQPQRDAEVDGADRRAEQEHILGSDILPHRAEQARDGDGEDMVTLKPKERFSITSAGDSLSSRMSMTWTELKWSVRKMRM